MKKIVLVGMLAFSLVALLTVQPKKQAADNPPGPLSVVIITNSL